MSDKNVFLDILNPDDKITNLDIDNTIYSNTSATELATNYPTIFSIVNNTAGVPVLQVKIPDTIPTITAWVQQSNTDAEFGIESRQNFTGTTPTCPPWQIPKP